VAAAGAVLIGIYFLIFLDLFSILGGLGHDFAMGLPLLLDGYFWFRNNGFFPVFWFSPFLCGGVPSFAHPIHFFYSLPQLLTIWTDPFFAVLINFLIFAALGFWGHYLLTRRVLGAGVWISLLCATLFLFNGFYTYHYIIGHFIYHAFMLVPWCVLLLTEPGLEVQEGRWRRNMGACAGVALLLGYMVYSAMQTLMPPVLLSIAAVCLLAGLARQRRFSLPTWLLRFAGAGLLAAGISAAKLSALYHLLRNMPRSSYPLPQFADLGNLLAVLGRSLFFAPAWEEARQAMVHVRFALKRHEFEFGLTVVPLFIFGAAFISWGRYLWCRRKERLAQFFNGRAVWLGLAIFLLLLLPVAVNFYTPGWNRFLKTVPVVGSSSQCTRWFCLYIPVITLLTAVAAGKTPLLKKFSRTIALAGVIGIVAWNLAVDKSYYQRDGYSPLPIMAAYYKVRHGEWKPAITDIGVCRDGYGRTGFPLYRNDGLIFGVSQLFGYDSVFGYGLENFPVKQLQPGPVFKEIDGYLNIKNPACYVFPKANHCRPGDHFTVAEKDKALAFTHYRPYAFDMPLLQRAANGVTVVSLILAGGLLVWFATGEWLFFRRQRPGSTEGSQV